MRVNDPSTCPHCHSGADVTTADDGWECGRCRIRWNEFSSPVSIDTGNQPANQDAAGNAEPLIDERHQAKELLRAASKLGVVVRALAETSLAVSGPANGGMTQDLYDKFVKHRKAIHRELVNARSSDIIGTGSGIEHGITLGLIAAAEIAAIAKTGAEAADLISRFRADAGEDVERAERCANAYRNACSVLATEVSFIRESSGLGEPPF